MNGRGIKLSPKEKANNYAPGLFAKEAEAKAAKIKKRDFEAAMKRLFDAKKIHPETYGPPAREHDHIVRGATP